MSLRKKQCGSSPNRMVVGSDLYNQLIRLIQASLQQHPGGDALSRDDVADRMNEVLTEETVVLSRSERRQLLDAVLATTHPASQQGLQPHNGGSPTNQHNPSSQ